jgi:hypothetical protein
MGKPKKQQWNDQWVRGDILEAKWRKMMREEDRSTMWHVAAESSKMRLGYWWLVVLEKWLKNECRKRSLRRCNAYNSLEEFCCERSHIMVPTESVINQSCSQVNCIFVLNHVYRNDALKGEYVEGRGQDYWSKFLRCQKFVRSSRCHIVMESGYR